MSLRFFSDQCVPAEITDTLRRHGHQVTLLREVLPIRSLDPAVIAKVQELGAILLSLNGDFADIVAYPPANYVGIVAVQLHNHPEIIPLLMERLVAFLDGQPAQEFYHGKLFIVEVHRVRIRQ
jgi:predicted nuclease of predicted toxin-antitoxin system